MIVSCLDALLKELSQPDEVIVVDNNSTDATADVVSKYALEDKRVVLADEHNQGTMFARKTGFDMAKGDLLCTIDADTEVLKGWREGMTTPLQDSDIDALSSYGVLDSSHLVKFNSFVTNKVLYSILPLFLGTSGFLFGSNMMMKNDVWDEISDGVRLHRDIWDDYEITLLVNEHHRKTGVVKQKLFKFSARRSLDSPTELAQYTKNGRKTLGHYSKIRSVILVVPIYLMIGLVIIFLKPSNYIVQKTKSD